MKFLFRPVLLLLLSASVMISCKKENDKPSSSNARQILAFKVGEYNGVVNDSDHTVQVNIPYEKLSDMVKATPDIQISEKATINPANGVEVNLRDTVLYTVTAENKTTQVYKAFAVQQLDNKLLSMTLDYSWRIYQGFIDETNHTVLFKVEFGWNFNAKKLALKAEISGGAAITPALPDSIDLTEPVVFTVKGANGKQQAYKVSIVNTANNIDYLGTPFQGIFEKVSRSVHISAAAEDFNPEDIVGMPADGSTYAVFTALEREDVSNIALSPLRLPVGATISPDPTVPRNYSKDVTYTVTSQAGTTRNIVIRCIKRKIFLNRIDYTPDETVHTRLFDDNSFYFWYLSALDIKAVALVDIKTKKEYPYTLGGDQPQPDGRRFMWVSGPAGIPKAVYHCKITLSDNTVAWDDMYIKE
jgi:hypothetical protein